MNTKVSQSKVYEFKPDKTITKENIIELAEVVRIGVSGNVLENVSEDLRKYFVEVTK